MEAKCYKFGRRAIEVWLGEQGRLDVFQLYGSLLGIQQHISKLKIITF